MPTELVLDRPTVSPLLRSATLTLVFADEDIDLIEAHEQARAHGLIASSQPSTDASSFAVADAASSPAFVTWLREYSPCEWVTFTLPTNDEAPRVLDDSRALLRQ